MVEGNLHSSHPPDARGRLRGTPTLRDIAAVAKVHHSTLSRALRGHPRISTEKAADLRALAERMGYVPDPILGALMAYRTGRRPAAYHATIAWLNPSRTRTVWRKFHAYVDYFKGAAERARQLGFHLEEIILPGEAKKTADEARITSILSARNINAVIVGPAPVPGMVLDMIEWSRFSAIRIGRSLERPPLHIVTSNHFHAMQTVFHEVMARGYKRPGLFLSDGVDKRMGRQWSAAFLREQLDLPPRHRAPAYLGEHYNEEVLLQWMSTARPDVIICMGDNLVRPTLQRRGVRVPEEVGVAALTQPNEEATLSGIVENNLAVGAAAVDLVVAMLNRQERGPARLPQTLLIENGWIEGGTLRARM